jgi:hypothetical protein
MIFVLCDMGAESGEEGKVAGATGVAPGAGNMTVAGRASRDAMAPRRSLRFPHTRANDREERPGMFPVLAFKQD